MHAADDNFPLSAEIQMNLTDAHLIELQRGQSGVSNGHYSLPLSALMTIYVGCDGGAGKGPSRERIRFGVSTMECILYSVISSFRARHISCCLRGYNDKRKLTVLILATAMRKGENVAMNEKSV